VNNNALVVPQIGVTHDQKGQPTALVVGADNKVTLAQLVTSGTNGSNWVVESGLKPGDRVIVHGTEKAKPGMTVKAIDAQMSAGPTASAAPAASSTTIPTSAALGA